MKNTIHAILGIAVAVAGLIIWMISYFSAKKQNSDIMAKARAAKKEKAELSKEIAKLEVLEKDENEDSDQITEDQQKLG